MDETEARAIGRLLITSPLVESVELWEMMDGMALEIKPIRPIAFLRRLLWYQYEVVPYYDELLVAREYADFDDRSRRKARGRKAHAQPAHLRGQFSQ